MKTLKVTQKLLNSLIIRSLAILTVVALICVSIIFVSTQAAQADPPEQTSSSDVSLNINSVISLSIFDSSSNPLANTDLEITPTQSGVQSSKLNTVVVGTNAPGYSLMAKAGYLPDLDELGVIIDESLSFNFEDVAIPEGVVCVVATLYNYDQPIYPNNCLEASPSQIILCDTNDMKTCEDSSGNTICKVYDDKPFLDTINLTKISLWEIFVLLGVTDVSFYACVTDAFWQSPDLLYQNPTTLDPKPAIPATANTLDGPNSLANNTWGFAVPKNQAGYSTLVPGLGSVASSSVGFSDEIANASFDNNYIEESSVVSSSKYASLPGHSKTIKQTEVPTNADATTLFYAAKVDLLQTAGNYKTQITYTAVANDVPEPPEEFRFTIDTRMTDTPFADGDTPESNPDHFANNATSFAIPTYNYTAGLISTSFDITFKWIINCGDGQDDWVATFVIDTNYAPVACNYDQPGEYQITIKSNGPAYLGWGTYFGFSDSMIDNSEANSLENRLMLKSLDTPIPKNITQYPLFIFSNARNAIGIPPNLLSQILPLYCTNNSYDFYETFHNYSYNSTTATIPTELLAGLNLSDCPDDEIPSFNGAFSGFAYHNKSNDGTPDTDINDVFAGVNFAGKITASNVYGIFNSTFQSMPSLTGTAQTFIDNQLGGAIPSFRAYTFDGTSVTDLDQLNLNWK